MPGRKEAISFPQRGNIASSVSMSRSNNEGFSFILRTRSLDESNLPPNDGDDALGQHSDLTGNENSRSALHSSFDTALLRGGINNCGSSFEFDDRGENSNVWDEGDVSIGDISGKKHLRPPVGQEAAESLPPGTVRKQARRIGNEINSKTPRRPPTVASKKPSTLTPSSAVKRRRAPLPHRLSPLSRMPPTTPGTHNQSLTATPVICRRLEQGPFESSLAGMSLPQSLTPTRARGQNSSEWSVAKRHNVATTTTTLLETTFEGDSVDTSSPATTRFRFTSFPASLPRVNNPRNRNCPDSVRKRMSFGDVCALDESNQSRDDDGTHNTSISSLSADGHIHLALPHGKMLPGADSYNLGGEDEDEDDHVHTQLFSDDENFGYSDDDTVRSPAREVVGRTRLNFNMVLSPDTRVNGQKQSQETVPMDLARPYDQGRINSFQSSLSSNTNIHGDDGADALTPARLVDKARPCTPREVQLHFPLETECSPIPGVREDPVDCRFGISSGSDHSRSLLGDGLISAEKRPSLEGSVASIRSREAKEAGSVASESTNERRRRLRPMPDISAFDSVAVSSRAERSADDSGTLDSKSMPSSQRLLCPPTPVRTPAWANENNTHTFFGRQNSLITTKVLLSCPSQVLVGRCSLESSVLDDDNRALNVTGASSDDAKNDVSVYLKQPQKRAILEDDEGASLAQDQILAPPKLTRRISSPQHAGSVISFSNDFEVLGVLGSGAFADVYKVRSVRDNRLYAVKRNRRQFRGKRDRDMALAEVQCMQRLQSTCITELRQTAGGESLERHSYSLYLLFFYNAWQEDAYFFCQTELCCRDTCRELLDALRSLWHSAKAKYPSLLQHLPVTESVQSNNAMDILGRSVPIGTIWKICHDISAGLSHIHSHGLVHNDIKPSNIFFVAHPRFGAMCKIGDFGMAGDIGSSDDGQEGDARYMPLELLTSSIKHPSADVFSLGLTLFELACDDCVEIPSEGPRWHELRSEIGPQLPNCGDNELTLLIKQMTTPDPKQRQNADNFLKIPKVKAAGHKCDEFLRDYLQDINNFDRVQDERLASEHHDEQTPRNGSHRSSVAIRSPSLSMMLPAGASLLSPLARPFY